MLTDTHAHLNFEDYKDLENAIKRSQESGVEKIICVSSNIEDSIQAIELAKKYKGMVYAAVGIHPQCTDPENKDDISVQLGKLGNLVLENKDLVVAIGEFGFDFTDVLENERKRSIEEQKELFQEQIGLAKKHGLPVLLHFNKAHDYFLENHQDIKDIKGVFHCYVGGKKRLKRFLEFEGFMFGVTGLITYDDGLNQVVKEIPLERIVFETDSPFLAPLPHRGERNEPAYISLIAKKLSELKEVGLDQLSRQTEDNVGKIFGI